MIGEKYLMSTKGKAVVFAVFCALQWILIVLMETCIAIIAIRTRLIEVNIIEMVEIMAASEVIAILIAFTAGWFISKAAKYMITITIVSIITGGCITTASIALVYSMLKELPENIIDNTLFTLYSTYSILTVIVVSGINVAGASIERIYHPRIDSNNNYKK